MEAAVDMMEKASAFVITFLTSGNLLLIAGVALALFLPGVILIYKKGPRLGVPLALAGILLLVIAILAQTISF